MSSFLLAMKLWLIKTQQMCLPLSWKRLQTLLLSRFYPQNMESSISKSTVNISISPNHTSLYQLHASASEKAKTLPKSQFAWKNPTALISATFVMFPLRLITGQHMLIHKPFSFCVEVTLWLSQLPFLKSSTRERGRKEHNHFSDLQMWWVGL